MLVNHQWWCIWWWTDIRKFSLWSARHSYLYRLLALHCCNILYNYNLLTYDNWGWPRHCVLVSFGPTFYVLYLSIETSEIFLSLGHFFKFFPFYPIWNEAFNSNKSQVILLRAVWWYDFQFSLKIQAAQRRLVELINRHQLSPQSCSSFSAINIGWVTNLAEW